MMSEEKYDLVFKGELIKSVSLEEAKLNISKLFKVTGSKLDALFSGKPVTLKRNLDFDTASKYRVAIKKAGARVDLVDVAAKPKPRESSSSPKAAGKAVFHAADAEPRLPEQAEASTQVYKTQRAITDTDLARGSVEMAVSGQVNVVINEPVEVAPVGTLIAEPKNEKLPIIDVSDMTIAEVGVDLLSQADRDDLPLIDVDTSNYDIAEVGADLLRPEEKSHTVEVDLDLGNYTLAEIGAQLEPKKPAPPPAPDVSKITLEEPH